MADQKDQYVAGPPDEPRPSSKSGGEPAAGAAGEPKAAPGPAAHHSPPPGPPQGAPPGPPHGPPPGAPYGPPPGAGGSAGPGVRAWARRRPAQLLAAGIVGAIIGGGAVGLIDLLDDGPERGYHHYDMRYGPGPGPGYGGEGWGRHHWQQPGGEGPMMPGRPGWRDWGQRPGMPEVPTEQPAPPAPAPATPTPSP